MTTPTRSIFVDAADPSPATANLSASEFLLHRINYERNPAGLQRVSLEGMQQLAHLLGDPHRRLTLVHVAGTKGKGSVAVMLSEILQEAGLKVGLFTSPHLHRMEERIVVDGQPIARDDFIKLIDRVRNSVEQLDRDPAGQPGPTFFDIFTAAGFLHFEEMHVDVAVIEVGLGGRLDSTNICTPICSVITSISRDHMKQLGSTIKQIAEEKAGIIKHQVPVISGASHVDAVAVIRQAANRHQAALVLWKEDFFACRRHDEQKSPVAAGEINYPCFDYQQTCSDGKRCHWPAIQLSMLGSHQIANAAIAVATAIQLQSRFPTIDEPAIRRGLAAARLPARIEPLHREPTVIVDGAHNEASITALCDTLDETWPSFPKRIVFGTTRGKDIHSMLRRLVKTANEIVLTQYLENPRAATPQKLQTIIQSLGDSTCKIRVVPNPTEAWQTTIATAGREELICVTGSLYLAAELRETMMAWK